MSNSGKAQDRHTTGFTLVELMIVVAIIGILAAIVYPSYSQYVTKSRRSDGQNTLIDIAAREERFFIDKNAYTTVISDLGLKSDLSPERYYKITAVKTDDPPSFTLTAAPQGPQIGDTDCGYLTYDSTGTKGAEKGTTHDCW